METITFTLGLALGLLLPLILEKYFFDIKKKKLINSDINEETIPEQPINYTPDLLEEWQTGIVRGSEDDE